MVLQKSRVILDIVGFWNGDIRFCRCIFSLKQKKYNCGVPSARRFEGVDTFSPTLLCGVTESQSLRDCKENIFY